MNFTLFYTAQRISSSPGLKIVSFELNICFTKNSSNSDTVYTVERQGEIVGLLIFIEIIWINESVIRCITCAGVFSGSITFHLESYLNLKTHKPQINDEKIPAKSNAAERKKCFSDPWSCNLRLAKNSPQQCPKNIRFE